MVCYGRLGSSMERLHESNPTQKNHKEETQDSLHYKANTAAATIPSDPTTLLCINQTALDICTGATGLSTLAAGTAYAGFSGAGATGAGAGALEAKMSLGRRTF
ncbi:hypothetical protein D5086_033879 [Populus alba]|uniref:Uncharacterized protein n=1 Tax=Populus alba TaxID=43335 RepID=A0ACC4AIZ8_POPAL